MLNCIRIVPIVLYDVPYEVFERNMRLKVTFLNIQLLIVCPSRPLVGSLPNYIIPLYNFYDLRSSN